MKNDALIGKIFGELYIVGKSYKNLSQNSTYIAECPNGHLFYIRKGNLLKCQYPTRKCPFCKGKNEYKRILHRSQKNNELGILGVSRLGKIFRARIDILGTRVEIPCQCVDDAVHARVVLEKTKRILER